MLRNAVRHGGLCLVAGSLLSVTGCCGVRHSTPCPTIYNPCTRACYGLEYSGGGCTCEDDVKDRINQVSDIFLQ